MATTKIFFAHHFERVDLNQAPCKRQRLTPPEPLQSLRTKKRKRLEQLYREQQPEIENAIMQNINQTVLQHTQTKRRRTSCSCACCTKDARTNNNREQQQQQQQMFSEKTVQDMIGIALETQKEKLLESFVEEHIDFVERQRAAIKMVEQREQQRVFAKQHDYFA